MKLSKSFRIALNIIAHSKIRSWLTIVGIVIGIAAIVSIVSIGAGAQLTLEQNLNSLSADTITITPGFSRAAGTEAGFRGGDVGGGPGVSQTTTGSNSPKNLTVTDVTLLKGIANVKQVMGIISGSTNSTYLGKSIRVSVEGVDPAVWKSMVSTDLGSGRYLSQSDTNVVVIGGRVANSTYSNVQINQQITIGGQTFVIVGILKESGGSDDSRIFMPIKNAVSILEDKDQKNFDSIIVKVNDISQTDDTVAQITSKLMLSHGILQSSKVDFSVTSLKSMQARVSTTLNSMSIFLGAIAAISLIVGAIGIMNSTFTSVLEKTREIGILKAIGARNKDILAIFLFNSAIIGFIGGVLGISFGIIASGFISELAGTASTGNMVSRFVSLTYVNPQLIVGVFLLSIGVGLLSGAIPAYRASRLKPVDALRYE
jgi:putative ABC transport system permease protein